MPAVEKITKGHCPECGAGINADIVAAYEHKWQHDDHPIWGQVDYRILKCRGCDSIYVQRAEVFSENINYYYDAAGDTQAEYEVDYSYWPSALKRTRPLWLDELFSVDTDLHSILNEVYSGLDGDLAVLSATGMRTAFDRATELLGVDPAKTFQQKLEDLFAAGKVGAAEKETLAVLADAGGAAAHRGWKPQPKQLGTMMDIVEAFCHRNFILDGQVGKLKPQIPAKQKRRRAEGDAPV
ncbi:DUF4145 domain-containing protein [Paraburkholderia sp. MMS20-SJTR3]|uniref:DUF4145 domain-containing protein n=1 Tax=Paraburkholderia sejongensis TaxID=2886946 RepID=A0ABS8K683_9BURK|nr:DUF4145 domain-containing protein [Paraburkholderia sp. MMS20-SJTR3]MCC8397682.1 DUF4145 domain-containing protein [Paraburkholderia sp. MMS20-SJTR3]